MALSPKNLLIWRQAQRRAQQYAPALRGELLKAFKNIESTLTAKQLRQYIETGGFERAFDQHALDQALARPRATLHGAVSDNTVFFGRVVSDTLGESFSATFNALNPNVLQGLSKLDLQAFGGIESDIKSVVQMLVQQGLEAGKGPEAIARSFEGMIGLAPNQVNAVQNFRGLLEAGDSDVFTRALRDKRFDRTIERAFNGEGLSTESIDRMVSVYQDNFVAFNAEVNARTMSQDAMKLGQRMSWEDAIDQGVIERTDLEKTWRGVKDSRERPEHLAMEGQSVPFDAVFSNGQLIPGDTDYNCRCIAIYSAR